MYFEFDTALGDFRIEPRRHGWVPLFRGEPLDGYHASPEAALRALVQGETDGTPYGTPTALGIPHELAGWRQR